MTNIFKVNWNRLVKFLVPRPLQKPLLMALLYCFISPLKTNHKSFMGFKIDAEYRVKHNGQICYLQKMLNDKFDKYLRRIRVVNQAPKVALWAYYIEDEKPLFGYELEDDKPLFGYNANDYYNAFDFSVIIPESLLAFTNQMQAQINYYKLFSKNYQIKSI